MANDDRFAVSRGLTDKDVEWLLELYDVRASFNQFASLPVRQMRLVIAGSALALTQSFLKATLGSSWVGGKLPGEDEWRVLYRIARASLLTSLEKEPEFAAVYEKAKELLPAALPLRDGEYWKWNIGLQPELAALEEELMQLGFPGPEAGVFLLTKDSPVNHVETLFRFAVETWGNKLSGQSSSSGPSIEIVSTQNRGPAKPGGRPPVDLDYETAARTWWEMKDEYEDKGETRGPTQEDLCNRLTALGLPIKPRNFRNYIKQWKTAGNNWPPPRPFSGKN